MLIGPSWRRMNQPTTASWPTTIAPNTNRPHSAVPQNFQTRGSCSAEVTVTGGPSGLRESISSLSRQCPLQQALDVVTFEVDGAVHAGVSRGKPGRRKQFRTARRDLVKRSGGGKQRQFLDRKPRYAL